MDGESIATTLLRDAMRQLALFAMLKLARCLRLQMQSRLIGDGKLFAMHPKTVELTHVGTQLSYNVASVNANYSFIWMILLHAMPEIA